LQHDGTTGLGRFWFSGRLGGKLLLALFANRSKAHSQGIHYSQSVFKFFSQATDAVVHLALSGTSKLHPEH
jgi:hypothetical protein